MAARPRLRPARQPVSARPTRERPGRSPIVTPEDPPPVPLPPPDPNDLIEFRGVAKRYDSGDVGLDGATFKVKRGEFVFLVGPTGSGKSTVMRLLIRELDPDRGTIRVAGRRLDQIDRRKVPYYRRNIGVVFQDYKLLPNRTVYDNVAYALQVTGGRRREIRDKVPDILRMTGLSLKLHSFPDQLSGGEQQRVSVARAFVQHPPLLLADEPTGNLDPETSIGIMQLLYRINRTGTTVVVATHDSAMVDRMRRRVIELNEGRIVRDEASGLYDARDESTAEFTARLRDEPGAVEPVRVARGEDNGAADADADADLDFSWSEPGPHR
jgi:cell division transport system ATP-binding protein